MIGEYIQGCGQAHNYEEVYRHFFNCPMKATFNVRADTAITDFPPLRTPEHPEGGSSKIWLVKVNGYYAWAYRSPNTKQDPKIWELVSKQLLPDNLKTMILELEVLDQWGKPRVDQWCSEHYVNQWHQTFDWSDRESAGSAMLWNAIEPHADWSGARVLDFGCGWGYHSFRASKLGASVVAIDKDIGNAIEINDHIECQDVVIGTFDIPVESFDIMLYLSVHHQIDPSYEILSQLLQHKRAHCKTLFVELILPPMFGTAALVDAATADAECLLEYKHTIRGQRALYKFES